MKAGFRFRGSSSVPAGAALLSCFLACNLSGTASAQLPALPAATPAPTAPQSAPARHASQTAGITEDELRQLLVGKTFFLRGGYLDASLSFNEHGGLIGHAAQGSFTLCSIEIEKVRLTKHQVELDGVRYGLHFLGALPYEDPGSAIDRVRITPQKKLVHITIARELVVKPKKVKVEKPHRVTTPAAKGAAVAKSPASANHAAAAGAAAAAENRQAGEAGDRDQQNAELGVAPAAAPAPDLASAAAAPSAAQATQMLREALANIFAPGLDARMIAAMPDFWRLYYQAAAARTDYRPSDPAVQRENTVDSKARLLSSLVPESNEYAQQAGVVGVALYHAVISAEGRPQEIAVGRPIGFGLDENAVAAIRQAKFAPALKDGKPVPVLLDLVVEFRIYSKRTAALSGVPPGAESPATPSLPGPYSVPHPQ